MSKPASGNINNCRLRWKREYPLLKTPHFQTLLPLGPPKLLPWKKSAETSPSIGADPPCRTPPNQAL
ncbi:hypothetical protein C1H46_010276 [Malus baccata]|uniref:Uncharacterized protein n=1 Tax=Malus baccata TaxID=106549 RepID=A0A540MZG2_MALBA|nr:hypothetical protein C1H46_010276 [Malus baccata]